MLWTRGVVAATLFVLLCAPVQGWGERGHVLINRLAVQLLPDDGPVFLRAHEEWIAQTGPVPDRWRSAAEPFVKIMEDANHHWYREAFSFLKEIPRSRYEFVLALYDEYRKIDLMKVPPNLVPNAFAGTLPYETAEGYERLKATMRLHRAQKMLAPALRDLPEPRFTEQDAAFMMGWLGHYLGDAAQPHHVTVNGNGWVLANPKGFKNEPGIHARFESAYLNLIEVTAADVRPLVPPARVIPDVFDAILQHIDKSAARLEDVYQLDMDGAFKDPSNGAARQLVLTQLASATALLRDLVYTAWIESAKPVAVVTPATDPLSPSNPTYNPATGSAPARKQ